MIDTIVSDVVYYMWHIQHRIGFRCTYSDTGSDNPIVITDHGVQHPADGTNLVYSEWDNRSRW